MCRNARGSRRVDDDVPSETPGGDGLEDRRRSRDVSRHIGFITNTVSRWYSKGHFRWVDFEELKNITIIEADRLLAVKYDPERATVSSFLSSYLFGRVEYHIRTSEGRRKRPTGWVSGSSLDPAARQRERPPDEQTDFDDLLSTIHPDFRDICRRLSEGESLEEIHEEIEAIPLFNTIRDRDHDISRSDLLMMLRAATRHLL